MGRQPRRHRHLNAWVIVGAVEAVDDFLASVVEKSGTGW
jgi:hypothetical protein